MNELINYEAVYRTASATPGLLKKQEKRFGCKDICKDQGIVIYIPCFLKTKIQKSTGNGENLNQGCATLSESTAMSNACSCKVQW